MLPEHGDEDEHGRDENESQCRLRNGSRREWLDFLLGTTGVDFLVPPWEREE